MLEPINEIHVQELSNELNDISVATEAAQNGFDKVIKLKEEIRSLIAMADHIADAVFDKTTEMFLLQQQNRNDDAFLFNMKCLHVKKAKRQEGLKVLRIN